MGCSRNGKGAGRKGRVNHVITCPMQRAERETKFISFTQEFLQNKMPPIVFELANRLKKAGARGVYAVGGVGRDLYIAFLNGRGWDEVENDDVDIEVVGLPMEKVTQVLKSFGYKVATDSQSFVVNKLFYDPPSEEHIDVAVPREERYNATLTCQSCHSQFPYASVSAELRQKHTCPSCGQKTLQNVGNRMDSYDIIPRIDFTPKEAALRRDTSMNAMMLDVETGELIDEYEGKRSIEEGVIHWVSPTTFPEDELRFDRVPRQATTTKFKIDPQLTAAAKEWKYRRAYIAPQRMMQEWFKMLAKGRRYEDAFRYFIDSTWGEFRNPRRVMANVHKVDQYLEGLSKEGQSFPVSNSKADPNRRTVFMAALLMRGEDAGCFDRNTFCIDKSVSNRFARLHRALSPASLNRKNVLHVLRELNDDYTWDEYLLARKILGLPEPDQETKALAARYNFKKPEPLLNGNEVEKRLLTLGIVKGVPKQKITRSQRKEGGGNAPEIIHRGGVVHVSDRMFGAICQGMFKSQLNAKFTETTEAEAYLNRLAKMIKRKATREPQNDVTETEAK